MRNLWILILVLPLSLNGETGDSEGMLDIDNTYRPQKPTKEETGKETVGEEKTEEKTEEENRESQQPRKIREFTIKPPVHVRIRGNVDVDLKMERDHADLKVRDLESAKSSGPPGLWSFYGLYAQGNHDGNLIDPSRPFTILLTGQSTVGGLTIFSVGPALTIATAKILEPPTVKFKDSRGGIGAEYRFGRLPYLALGLEADKAWYEPEKKFSDPAFPFLSLLTGASPSGLISSFPYFLTRRYKTFNSGTFLITGHILPKSMIDPFYSIGYHAGRGSCKSLGEKETGCTITEPIARLGVRVNFDSFFISLSGEVASTTIEEGKINGIGLMALMGPYKVRNQLQGRGFVVTSGYAF